jgi:hypothetical protein
VKYEDAFKAVQEGRFVEPTWIDMVSTHGGVTVRWRVAQDALLIYSPDAPDQPWRASVSATSAQRICDDKGWTLLTSLMVDDVHRASASAFVPITRVGKTITALADPKAYSAAVDARVAHTPGRPTSSVGKDWILDRNITGDTAVNYGWHDVGAPYRSVSGLALWQSVGRRHNRWHIDASQVLRPAQQTCLVEADGVCRQATIAEVLQGPASGALLGGPLALGSGHVRYRTA